MARHVPILAHRETLLWALENRSTVVIVGETGCGKSTQVPKFLVEAGWAAPPRCVVSTQPRSVAARELASRVAGELGCDGVGGPVGFAYRFEERWCPERTRLKFTTDGWLLREALFDPLFLHYSVVMVDEAHERSAATDVLLGLLKKVQRARREAGDPLRVVVSSATADAEGFAAFFGAADSVVARVDGRQYPVDVFYADAALGSDYVAAAVAVVERLHAAEKDLGRAFLVFLPGAREVDEACRALRGSLADPARPAVDRSICTKRPKAFPVYVALALAAAVAAAHLALICGLRSLRARRDAEKNAYVMVDTFDELGDDDDDDGIELGAVDAEPEDTTPPEKEPEKAADAPPPPPEASPEPPLAKRD